MMSLRQQEQAKHGEEHSAQETGEQNPTPGTQQQRQ